MKDKSKGKKKKNRKPKSSSKHYSDSSIASSPSEYSNSSSSEDERRHRRKYKKKHKQDYNSDVSSSPASSSEDERRKHRKRRRDVDSKDRKKKKRKSKKQQHGRDKEDVNDNEPLLSPVDVASVILSKFPELSGDLEQLLKMLDDGQGVDISGLQNKELAAYLQELFRSLHLHRTSKGLFLLPEGAAQKTMDILGPCFSSHGTNEVPQLDTQDGTKKDEDVKADNYDVKDHVDPEVAPNNDCPGPTEPKRSRVLGPAMPSTEMLEAAAKLTEAGVLLREAEEELEFSPLVGPPPPAAVTEAESANEAERFEEVERILAPDIENAYELLGLRVGTTPELLKKRYWKLSLLVHPDKCSHPRAHEAFTTLNQAFKDLQDPTKRSIIDQKIEEKETRREFEAELKAKKEAAQWRKLRGVMLVGDEELLDDTPKVLKRDEWMTELPPERKPGAPTMHSTFFSKNGKSGRGDTSCWTDTPAEKAQKAKMAYLEAYSQAALTGDTSDKQEPSKKELRPEIAEIMDKFNAAKRGTSLLEKHQADRTKKVKKSSKKAEPAPPPEWVESHPWKPWDRDKDLAAGRQSVKLDKLSMGAGLSSRFASSHEERSFL